MQIRKLRGGFLQIGGDEVSPLANDGRPWREREKEGINEELVKVCGVGFLGNIGILERWKILWLW